MSEPAVAEQQKYTFRGKSVAETMRKITEKLGKNALIFEKRRLKKKGALSGFLGGDEQVEIIAAPPVPMTPGNQSKPTLLQKTYCTEMFKDASGTMAAPAPRKAASGAVLASLTSGSGLAAKLDSIAGHLEDEARRLDMMRAEMRSLFALQTRGGLPAVDENLMHAFQRLVDAGVSSEMARGLVERVHVRALEQIRNTDDAWDQVCKEVARGIETAGPINLDHAGPTVAALVGPTGVGKTTTILKLAFEFAIRRGLRVAVITEDVQRPGAVEQLRGLEHLIGMPVVRAETPQRAGSELRHLDNFDLVLVDTAGRSPRDRSSIEKLASYIQTVGAHETHLVLSSCGSWRMTEQAFENFGQIGFDRIIFSKLDEVCECPLILELAGKPNAVTSYVTTGQAHMQSIQVAQPEILARMALGMTGDADSGDDGS